MCFCRHNRYVGKQLGQYTIKALVGEGRYGACFLAISESGNRVIIKKFKPVCLKECRKKCFD